MVFQVEAGWAEAGWAEAGCAEAGAVNARTPKVDAAIATIQLGRERRNALRFSPVCCLDRES
jgi:hypothetical protein